MAINGHPVKEIVESFGYLRSIIYKWKIRHTGSSFTIWTSGSFRLTGGVSATERAVKGPTAGGGTGKGFFLKKSVVHFQPGQLSMLYAFIRSEQHNHPVMVTCKVLDVSRSRYYAYCKSGDGAQSV